MAMQAHAAAAEKSVVDELFADADAQYEQIRARMTSRAATELSHAELEDELEITARELCRRLFQDHLRLRKYQAGQHGFDRPVVGSDGVERKQVRESERGLETVFGGVRAERDQFERPGHVSLHPLDAGLNLPEEKFSYGVSKRAAEEVTKQSFDSAVAAMNKYTGAHIAKRQFEDLIVKAARDFDWFYAARETITQAEADATSEILVLTFDGKGVRMLKKALREATRLAAEAQCANPGPWRQMSAEEKRLQRHGKRMAIVAAVYTIAPYCRTPQDLVRDLAPVRDVTEQIARPRPECKRVWASLKKDPEVVMREAFKEALRRDPERKKRWVVLVDGNETQLGLLEILRHELGLDLTIILDVIHVRQYLWRAAEAFHPKGSKEAETWVNERFLRVLEGDITGVAAGMTRSATKRRIKGTKREAVDKCAKYILNNRAYMPYREALKRGFPVATGVIEGACRHLVQDRMELTGAKWALLRAEAVLRLRALISSGDFDEYWKCHLAREYERNHEIQYLNRAVPRVSVPASGRKPRAPHLQVVR
jgi:hypothetical protein